MRLLSYFRFKAPINIVIFLYALVVSILFVTFIVLEEMGQSQVTPLSLFQDHFSEFKTQAKHLGLEVKKGKLFIFCRNVWPTYEMGWPEEGTFDLPTIYRVKDVIYGRPGHPE